MKSIIKIIPSIMFLGILSCGQTSKDKAFKTFNEGVSLNLNSIDEQNKGNFEQAELLNKQSIDKFKETLRLDSTHAAVRAALGHSLYVDEEFKEAMFWFEQSNKVNGESAENFRELGLCKINLGQITPGKTDIDKAFSMDTSKAIRDLTLSDLTGIGDLAFTYGDGYIKDGDSEKGKQYKIFSIGVLMLVYDYDHTQKEIALKVSDFADKIGDKKTSVKYKNFASSQQ